MGERCKLPQQGPGLKTDLMKFEMEMHLTVRIVIIFEDIVTVKMAYQSSTDNDFLTFVVCCVSRKPAYNIYGINQKICVSFTTSALSCQSATLQLRGIKV